MICLASQLEGHGGGQHEETVKRASRGCIHKLVEHRCTCLFVCFETF
jgi:hypothetical protein